MGAGCLHRVTLLSNAFPAQLLPAPTHGPGVARANAYSNAQGRRNFLIHRVWCAHYADEVAGSAPHGCRNGGPVSPAMVPVPTPSALAGPCSGRLNLRLRAMWPPIP